MSFQGRRVLTIPGGIGCPRARFLRIPDGIGLYDPGMPLVLRTWSREAAIPIPALTSVEIFAESSVCG